MDNNILRIVKGFFISHVAKGIREKGSFSIYGIGRFYKGQRYNSIRFKPHLGFRMAIMPLPTVTPFHCPEQIQLYNLGSQINEIIKVESSSSNNNNSSINYDTTGNTNRYKNTVINEAMVANNDTQPTDAGNDIGYRASDTPSINGTEQINDKIELINSSNPINNEPNIEAITKQHKECPTDTKKICSGVSESRHYYEGSSKNKHYHEGSNKKISLETITAAILAAMFTALVQEIWYVKKSATNSNNQDRLEDTKAIQEL